MSMYIKPYGKCRLFHDWQPEWSLIQMPEDRGHRGYRRLQWVWKQRRFCLRCGTMVMRDVK